MNALLLECASLNALNKAAKEILTIVLPQLDKYKGKQVTTQTGFSKKFVIDQPDVKAEALPDGNASCQYWLSERCGGLYLNVKICLSGGSYDVRPATYYCKYQSIKIHIADIDSNVLNNIQAYNDIVKSYGLDVVVDTEAEQAKIDAIKKLMEQVSEIRRTVLVSSEFYSRLIR